jgi:hypothetical protein
MGRGITASAGGTCSLEPGGGMTSLPPETQFSTTVSPELIVISGGKAASKPPHRTVSGVGARRCVAMGRFPASIGGTRPSRSRRAW